MQRSTSPVEKLQTGTIAVLGVPFDAHASGLRGAAQGPQAIRAALHSPSTNLSCENGIDLGSTSRWRDLGDLQLGHDTQAFAAIEAAVRACVQRGARVLTWGGDHSITYPVLRAYAAAYPDLTVLHLDAHPDLYDSYEGNRYSHASPFARIMEEGLARRLVQLGIRTMNAHQRQQAERFGVEVIEMRAWRPDTALEFGGPLYVSLDLDCLDPAFAPGVSHREPGGFSAREVIGILQSVTVPIVGADVVELNPTQDPLGITAMLAAKLSKELLACLLE